MLHVTIRNEDYNFSATQHCHVGTVLQPFETMSQQCCYAAGWAKNRRCESSSVITFKPLIPDIPILILQTDTFLYTVEDWLREIMKRSNESTLFL